MERDKLSTKLKKDSKIVGGKAMREKLSFEQRKDLMSLIKRMIPPVPSRGLIDLRFTFWFIKSWYVVFIFGQDLRKQFKADDKGDVDRSLVAIARIFTYFTMSIILIILIVILLYILKTLAGIDLYPDTHFIDIIKSKLGMNP